MADSRGRSSHSRSSSAEDEPMFNTRSIETFSRKITATAGHLMAGDASVTQHYQNAMGEIHRELRNPLLQRQLFSLAQTSPRELVRSKLSTTEIQHRALTYLPDELFQNMPEGSGNFSLFQGFQASLPEVERQKRRRSGRHASRAQKLLEEHADNPRAPESMKKLRNEKNSLDQRIDMIEVRKNMCSTEIKEIDNKIANLNTMRKIVLDRLADLEQEESQLEQDMLDLENSIEDAQEEIEDEAALHGQKTPTTQDAEDPEESKGDSPAMEASFMSESIHQKLASPASKRPRASRRKTNFILHEHLQAGSKIRQIQAHEDTITAMDFDMPFGTMVTAALDDTVRVWDLNAGRCMGLLEGHLSSVRCLQVEENIVATGSMDATIRLWDLNQAEYTPPPTARALHRKQKRKEAREARETASGEPSRPHGDEDDDDEDDSDEDFLDASEERPPSNMVDCPMFSLSAHVAEITALHFQGNTLVSGSADKTLRQWDLEKGRCVQTLDVLWAAAQAASLPSASSNVSGQASESTSGDQAYWRQPSLGRGVDSNADFVGAVQCFDAALACGTADGMVRLWDLRSGQVHRSLVGHTGAITSLQFDDVHLVTASADRSVRIWDLRTGGIFDAYAYDHAVTSVMFDAKSIAAAAGESVVKIYDKTDGRHWDCGMQVGLEGREEDARPSLANVDQVRIKDGFMVEGRKDGMVGVWSV